MKNDKVERALAVVVKKWPAENLYLEPDDLWRLAEGDEDEKENNLWVALDRLAGACRMRHCLNEEFGLQRLLFRLRNLPTLPGGYEVNCSISGYKASFLVSKLAEEDIIEPIVTDADAARYLMDELIETQTRLAERLESLETTVASVSRY